MIWFSSSSLAFRMRQVKMKKRISYNNSAVDVEWWMICGTLRDHMPGVFAISSHISVTTCQSVSPEEGQVFFSGITNVDTISFSDKVFFMDVIMPSIERNSLLYICSDICSYASAQTCWTGNKSDYGVRGVMFNNKKYYLPRSMCVAIAIKYNELKVLEACSKFWCVVILNTLWQHTACQGCKTSSNRLLNIRPTTFSHTMTAIHHAWATACKG